MQLGHINTQNIYSAVFMPKQLFFLKVVGFYKVIGEFAISVLQAVIARISIRYHKSKNLNTQIRDVVTLGAIHSFGELNNA